MARTTPTGDKLFAVEGHSDEDKTSRYEDMIVAKDADAAVEAFKAKYPWVVEATATLVE